MGRNPNSLFWCPDFTDRSSHGKNTYHEQEKNRLHIRSAVITGIHHAAEWGTTCAGKYWHEIMLFAAASREGGYCSWGRTNAKYLFLLIIVGDAEVISIKCPEEANQKKKKISCPIYRLGQLKRQYHIWQYCRSDFILAQIIYRLASIIRYIWGSIKLYLYFILAYWQNAVKLKRYGMPNDILKINSKKPYNTILIYEPQELATFVWDLIYWRPMALHVASHIYFISCWCYDTSQQCDLFTLKFML